MNTLPSTPAAGEFLFLLGFVLLALPLLRARKWLAGFFLLQAGWVWVVFYKSVFNFLQSLGVDSFIEVSSFEVEEAKFWLKALFSALEPSWQAWKILVYYFGALLVFFLLEKTAARKAMGRKIVRVLVPFAAIGSAFYLTVSAPLALFIENSEEYLNVKRNFLEEMPEVIVGDRDIQVVVYIGESTTVMNMGVYGYPRNTTPQLSRLAREKQNLVLFDNVFSTHTHTSQSLLEAFSFATDSDEIFLPISQRKRASIIDVLQAGGIRTALFSNQGMAGSWNQVASIAFRNARKVFSAETRHLGNDDHLESRPWDHEFFDRMFMKNAICGNADEARLHVFHSYAGHGDYLKNIPKNFSDVVDGQLQGRNLASIFGNAKDFLSSVEAYDSAVKYIDHSISRALEKVDGCSRPIVFVYFSDHGESVYSGHGHDSSRFTHEMARIPFFVYFNDAAISQRPDLFEKYRGMSKERHVATLAQLPATLMDLLGARFTGSKGNSLIQAAVIGQPVRHPPIIVRETAEEISFINLNDGALLPVVDHKKKISDRTDSATKTFVATATASPEGPYVCYHRANALGKALRGALVARCLEFDIQVEEDGNIAVYHPPEKYGGLDIEDVFQFFANEKYVFWLDGKNIQTRRNCHRLLDFVEKNERRKTPGLIEFPSGSHRSRAEITDCISGLRKKNYAISYYVPTDQAIRCAKSIAAGVPFKQDETCIALDRDLRDATESELFTDISFDYSGIAAIEAMPLAMRFRWNAWSMPAGLIQENIARRFGMLILDNNDPNTR